MNNIQIDNKTQQDRCDNKLKHMHEHFHEHMKKYDDFIRNNDDFVKGLELRLEDTDFKQGMLIKEMN